MALTIVRVASGGLPVVESDRGIPYYEADNGFGIPVTFGSTGTPLSGVVISSLPPIPEGFTRNTSGYLVDSNGVLWYYVVDNDGKYLIDNTGKYYITPVDSLPDISGSGLVYSIDSDGAYLTDISGTFYTEAA